MPVTFERTFADRIVRSVRFTEALPPRPGDDAAPQVPNTQFVRVIGPATGNSGSGSSGSGLSYYPAQVEVWNATLEEPKILGQVWLHEFNDRPLLLDAVYPANQSGDFEVGEDERPLFICAIGQPPSDDGGGGSSSSSSAGACAGGLNPKDLLRCADDGSGQVASGCLKLVDGSGNGIEGAWLALFDPNGNLVAGGPP